MIHIVLYQPEIPQNTGNIIRTCMAINATLHLIKPLGFSLDEKSLKRAGMDYINDVELEVYKSVEEFENGNCPEVYSNRVEAYEELSNNCRGRIIVNKTGFGGLPIQRISDEAAEKLLWMAVNAGISY